MTLWAVELTMVLWQLIGECMLVKVEEMQEVARVETSEL